MVRGGEIDRERERERRRRRRREGGKGSKAQSKCFATGINDQTSKRTDRIHGGGWRGLGGKEKY